LSCCIFSQKLRKNCHFSTFSTCLNYFCENLSIRRIFAKFCILTKMEKAIFVLTLVLGLSREVGKDPNKTTIKKSRPLLIYSLSAHHITDFCLPQPSRTGVRPYVPYFVGTTQQLGCPRKCVFDFRRNTEFVEKHTEFRGIPRNSAVFFAVNCPEFRGIPRNSVCICIRNSACN
jgi:hypothetical protein